MMNTNKNIQPIVELGKPPVLLGQFNSVITKHLRRGADQGWRNERGAKVDLVHVACLVCAIQSDKRDEPDY